MAHGDIEKKAHSGISDLHEMLHGKWPAGVSRYCYEMDRHRHPLSMRPSEAKGLLGIEDGESVDPLQRMDQQ
jgi:hypothetical protein